MYQIPINDYLNYSFVLTKQEENLRKVLLDWLPEKIIDCHVHCNRAEDVLSINQRTMNHMMSTFPHFTLEQSLELDTILFLERNIRKLRFSHVFSGIDHKSANEYLVKNSSQSDRVALYGIPNDIPYTIQQLRSKKYSALKMYYMFFDPPANRIYEFFPREILEEAQSLQIPIILHLPKIITQCVDDLLQVVHDFPTLPVVLAHLGLPNVPIPGLNEAYTEVARYENVYMDTSLIPSKEVVSMAIKAFGIHRIMYGSDEPLNLIRATVYVHPQKGQRLITNFNYHWVDQEEHMAFRHLAVDCIQTHWKSLEAIRLAIKGISSQEQIAENAIFYDTAKSVFGF